MDEELYQRVEFKQRANAELGPPAAELFLKFVEPVDQITLMAMIRDVEGYLDVLEHMASKMGKVDMKLAKGIATACVELVRKCPFTDPWCMSLVAGAVRYFVYPFDAEDDVSSETGLDDDAEVVNFVIKETGLPVDPVAMRVPG